LSALLINTGQFQESEVLLIAAEKKKPGNRGILYELSRLYLETGNADKAKEYIEKGLKLSAYDADFNYLQARLYIQRKQYSLASKKIDHNLKLHPNHYPSHLARGELLLKRRQYNSAKNSFETARLIRPEVPETYVKLSQISLEQTMLDHPDGVFAAPPQPSDFEETIQHLLNAKNYDNLNVSANLALGQLYAQLNICDEAIPYLESVLYVNPNHFSALYYRGYCNPVQAIMDYAAMLKQDPGNDLLRHAWEKAVSEKYAGTLHPHLLSAADYHAEEARSLRRNNFYTQSIQETKISLRLVAESEALWKILLDHYRAEKNFFEYSQVLDILRKKYPGENYSDQYEIMMHARSSWLYYREKIQNPLQEQSQTPVYVFNFTADKSIPEIPDAGRSIADTLSERLNQEPNISSVTDKQRAEALTLLKQIPQLGIGGFYSPASAAAIRNWHKREHANEKPLRFVVTGSYVYRQNGVEIQAQLKDLSTGKNLATVQAISDGRGYLRRATEIAAQKLTPAIPWSGRVLRVGATHITVNLGTKNLPASVKQFKILRNGQELAVMEKLESDSYISTAKPQRAELLYSIRPGDEVIPFIPEGGK